MKDILYGDLRVEMDDEVWLEDILRHGKARHPETLRFLHRKLRKMADPVMLDIGAHLGRYSLLAKFTPGMTVFAFEPNPAVYKLLESNIRLNGMRDRITPLPYALWREEGKAVLYAHPWVGRSRSATMGKHPRRDGWDKIKVETRKLDSFRHLWSKVDLIKLDVEGAEWPVLRGGRRTIKQDLPPIWMEYTECTANMFGYCRSDVVKHLETWGYKRFEPRPPSDIWATT